MDELAGSTTLRQKPVAIAASTAFPPLLSMSTPTWAAIGCAVATAPRSTTTSSLSGRHTLRVFNPPDPGAGRGRRCTDINPKVVLCSMILSNREATAGLHSGQEGDLPPFRCPGQHPPLESGLGSAQDRYRGRSSAWNRSQIRATSSLTSSDETKHESRQTL